MSPRLRRLKSDQSRIESRFRDGTYIRLIESEGDPAERYLIELRVPGLVPTERGPDRASQYRLEVFLPLEYPRRPPFCRMVTPVFHPNIDPQKVCIGDHWSAGQSLSDLVVRVAEMICFQSYNVQSPLNGDAAAWVEQHVSELPLLQMDLGGDSAEQLPAIE